MSQRPLIKEGRKGIPSYHHDIMCVRLYTLHGGAILLTYDVAFASLQLESFFRAGFSPLLLFSSGAATAADAKTTWGIGGEREERGGAKDGNVEYGTLKVTGWMEEEGKRRTIFRGYSSAPPFSNAHFSPAPQPQSDRPTDPRMRRRMLGRSDPRAVRGKKHLRPVRQKVRRCGGKNTRGKS